MGDWSALRERRLVAMVAAALAVVLAVDAYHHLTLEPVTLPTLLFELLEILLLVGCAVTCTLLILRVRVPEMLVATATMLAVLLAGELYLGVEPVTPPMLLAELLEAALVVGSAIAWAFLVRRIS